MKTLISLIAPITLVFLFSIAAASQSADAELAKLNGELTALAAKRDYAKASPVAKRIVELTIQKYGKEDLQTARALANEGLVEKASGDARRAAGPFSNAVDIFEKQTNLSKVDLSRYASSVEGLADIKLEQQNPTAATSLYKKALALREKATGPDSPETALSLASLGNLSFWERDFETSAGYYSRALANLANSKKANKDELALIYYRTECTYRKAKMEDRFKPLEELYGKTAEFRSVVGQDGVEKLRAALIHSGVVNGKAIKLDKPVYPQEARQTRVQGTVEVDVLINEKGEVLSACASNKAHPALVAAAEGAALRSKFSPTTLEGDPIKVSGRIIYKFVN